MNIFEHEDAFKDANLYAGSVVDLGHALRVCDDKQVAALIIQDCQKQYSKLFEAFIAGVNWGREHAKKDSER